MKRHLLLLFIISWFIPAAWAVETTDHFTISNVTVDPGGSYASFDVSLVGSRKYTAYNLDIHFPIGLSVYYNNNKPAVSLRQGDGIYPYTEDLDGNNTYTHTLSCTYGEAGERTLRIACSSTQSEEFTANSGKLFRVYVIASPFLKPGTASLTFDGQNLTTSDETKYVPANQELTVNVSTSSTVPISISATNQYGTCVVPFDTALPTGLEAFSCNSEDNGDLVLTPVESLSAYVPYILYAETGYTGNLSGTVDATNYAAVVTAGYLKGAVEPQQVSEGYILQNQGSGAKFYKINGTTFAIPAGHCWITVPSLSLARAEFELSQETTAIKVVQAEEATNAELYSLDGKRVSNPKQGTIYISNGKKLIK